MSLPVQYMHRQKHYEGQSLVIDVVPEIRFICHDFEAMNDMLNIYSQTLTS